MRSDALTVEEYLDELSPERKAAVQKVRQVILGNLPQGIEEAMGIQGLQNLD